MLTILFIIFLIAIIIGYKIMGYYNDSCCNEVIGFIGYLTVVLSVISEIIVVICTILSVIGISKLKISDELIKMYETENSNIQKQVSEIIENYKTYEKDSYTESLEKINIKDTDILVLSQLYPDLKSNDLVKEQIKIYQENNKKIKQIKEEKLNNEICKWWLYFGK